MSLTEGRAIETLYSLGHWLLEQDRAADAIHVFRTMLVTAPDDERSWLGLGLCHERKGEDTIAHDLYELAESVAPLSFRCPLARARLLRRGDAEDRAQQAYEAAEQRAAETREDEIVSAIARERSSE
jgi:tetratricopeptide (TPR) repeat protein